MDSRKSLASSVVLGVCIVLAVAVARARAEAPGGITVMGVGESRALPTRLEVATSVSGQGELAGDAQTKYRDASKRAAAALQALKIEGLEVKGLGFGLVNPANQQQMQMRMMGMGGQPAATQPSFNITERLSVTVDHVDKLEPEKVVALTARVIDAIKDAGLKIGEGTPSNILELQMMQQGMGSGGVQFKLMDPSAAKDAACAQAMANARAKAVKLAELAGVKLGRVVAVSEADVAGNDPQALMRMIYGARGGTRTTEISSLTFQPIAVAESLTVTFAIEK